MTSCIVFTKARFIKRSIQMSFLRLSSLRKYSWQWIYIPRISVCT